MSKFNTLKNNFYVVPISIALSLSLDLFLPAETKFWPFCSQGRGCVWSRGGGGWSPIFLGGCLQFFGGSPIFRGLSNFLGGLQFFLGGGGLRGRVKGGLRGEFFLISAFFGDPPTHPTPPPPPPPGPDTGIRSTFFRYASYWNAFL